MERIFRITLHSGWDEPGRLSTHRIDIHKMVNGEYVSKFKDQNESGEIVDVKNGINRKIIENLIKRLSTLNISAVPEHILGCDMGSTEIEISGRGGKSVFSWTFCPTGWEELDRITTELLICAGFETEAQ